MHIAVLTQGKTAGDALGKTYDFTSVYQARAIISRAGMAATRDLELLNSVK